MMEDGQQFLRSDSQFALQDAQSGLERHCRSFAPLAKRPGEVLYENLMRKGWSREKDEVVSEGVGALKLSASRAHAAARPARCCCGGR